MLMNHSSNHWNIEGPFIKILKVYLRNCQNAGITQLMNHQITQGSRRNHKITQGLLTEFRNYSRITEGITKIFRDQWRNHQVLKNHRRDHQNIQGSLKESPTYSKIAEGSPKYSKIPQGITNRLNTQTIHGITKILQDNLTNPQNTPDHSRNLQNTERPFMESSKYSRIAQGISKILHDHSQITAILRNHSSTQQNI